MPAETRAKAACLSINFTTEDVKVDFFEVSAKYPDPGLMAEAFMESVRGDFPGYEFTVWKNAAAAEMAVDRLLGREVPS